MKDTLVWGVTPDLTRVPKKDTWVADIKHNIQCHKNGTAGHCHMTKSDAQEILLAVLAAGDIALGDTVSKSMRPLTKDRKGFTGTIHGCLA